MGRASLASRVVRTHNTNLATTGRPLASNRDWTSSRGQRLELDLQWRLNGGHWTQLPLAVALLKRPLDVRKAVRETARAAVKLRVKLRVKPRQSNTDLRF